MASARRSASSDKLEELKKDAVTILRSCEGHCLDLSRFKEEYKKRFRRKFDIYFRELLKGKKLKHLMAELNDVILLEQPADNQRDLFLMKLKELDSNRSTTKVSLLSTPGQLGSSAEVGINSVTSPKSSVSLTTDKKSSVGASAKRSVSAREQLGKDHAKETKGNS